MKVLVVVPSKGRPDVFSKFGKKFIATLGVDSVVLLEKEDYELYDHPNKVLLEKSNAGLGYSLSCGKKYAKENGYDIIFKIDDDVKGIGTIVDDLETIISYFEKYPNLGAVCFPYDFEFYNKSDKLFTHINKRIQTCYLIRTDSFRPMEGVNTFEDFSQFFHIVNNNEFTLFCARHAIKCKPVGGGTGGCQAFDRKEQAEKEIEYFKSIDPTIGVIVKENKSWYYEPKFTGKQYKSKKI